MKIRFIIAFIITVLVVGFSISFQSCDTGPTLANSCTLPPPDTAYVIKLSPTSAQLNWSPVDSAQGYQVIVIDSTSGNVVKDTTISAQDTSLTINNLAPGHSFYCFIAAICGGDLGTSRYFVQVRWIGDDTVFLEDVVVMMNGGGGSTVAGSAVAGMASCNCAEITDNEIVLDEVLETNFVLPIDFGLNDRKVVLVSFSERPGVEQKFKLAFTGGNNGDCRYVRYSICAGGSGSLSLDTEEPGVPNTLTIKAGISSIDIQLTTQTLSPLNEERKLLKISPIVCGSDCKLFYTICSETNANCTG